MAPREAMCTTFSTMPRKKNANVFMLARVAQYATARLPKGAEGSRLIVSDSFVFIAVLTLGVHFVFFSIPFFRY